MGQNNELSDAPSERVLLLDDHKKLLDKTFAWLQKTYSSTIHTNRILDTGWYKMSFDFTVTDELFMKCFGVRVLRKPQDIKLLRRYLDEVQHLVDSGVKDNGILFSLSLILTIPSDLCKKDIFNMTTSYSFLEKIEYLND